MTINNILVAGAGQMGHGIAQIALMAGYNVSLYDINQEFLKLAKSRILKGLKISVSKGIFSSEATCQEILEKLVLTNNLRKSIKNVDFVFEAIPEKPELKEKFYAESGKYGPKDTIYASNTSTISIKQLAKASPNPENVVGMHFFYPVPRQCCVEVMQTEYTSDRTLNTATTMGANLPCIKGKRLVALCYKDSPGFIANRLLLTGQLYINWVVDKAYELGVSCEQIDLDAGGGTLIPMGPCELNDYLGLDTAYNSMRYFELFVSKDFTPGKVLTNLVTNGNYGKKTGKGFYEWTPDGKPIKKGLKKTGLFDPETLLAIQLNEGCKLIEEGVVKGYKIIDEVMLRGTSMPGPFGPGKRNYQNWCELLEELTTKTGNKIFKPCELMKSGNFKNYRA